MPTNEKNIKKESFIFGICIFLYFFIIALILLGRYQPVSSYAQLLIGSLIVAITLGVTIYFGKKCLLSREVSKIFYKMPLAALITSVIISVLIEIYYFLYISINNIGGDAGLATIYWPFYSLFYIGGALIVSLILTTYLYAYNSWGKKTLLKWIAIILLALPYLAVILTLWQKSIN